MSANPRAQLLQTVKDAIGAGLCVIPPSPSGTKQPLPGGSPQWQGYQKQVPTPEELREWYSDKTVTGIGLVCGGNLECFDVDERDIYGLFRQRMIDAGLDGLLSKLEQGYMENTPNGVHLLYRCETISGNTKLATRPKKPEEMKDSNDKTKTLLETRGEGGYIITAPTYGPVNPSGSYELVSGSFATIPTITPAERQALHDVARTFNILDDKQLESEKRQALQDAKGGGRPGDDFNQRATWNDILPSHGWKAVFTRGDTTYWCRPGKDFGISATTNHQGGDLLYVFSSSTPFEPNRGYTKFSAYTILEHGGDYSAAARDLSGKGYGDTTPARENGLQCDSESLEWPEPSSLPEGLPPVKSLEPEMLPEPLRGWLMDIADRMQIPPDFSAAAAVVALGSIIGRGCGIHPKHHDDWLVVPNLWGAVVGRPSLMKTPAISESQKPLVRLETEERESYQEAARAFELDKEVMKITKSALGEEIKKAVKQGKPDDIESARARLAALQADGPIRRRYQTQDGTTEKIGELLIENPRGLLVNRDELLGWFRSLERDGREGDRSFYLEAWNGNRGFTYDRIGRGTLDIPALCMSVFGAMTPGPLASYVYQANSGGRGDDGLLQRFQVIVWPDAQGEWRNIDRYPDTAEKNRVWDIFKALSGDIPGAVKEEGAAIPSLRFTLAGQEVFDTWRHELETRLRGDHGLHPAMESHLTKYRKLMPSLALIFHLVAVADGATSGPVSEVSAVLAAAWCQYLESHAGRIYGAATMPGLEAAREIVKHIRRGAISEGCTPKNIYRNQWSRLTSPEEVKAGLEVLAGYDWLTVDRTTPGRIGGRPSEIIRLNPLIKL